VFPLGIAGRASQLSGIPGASFQFGRTSIHLPPRPHLLHLARRHGRLLPCFDVKADRHAAEEERNGVVK
jgi:hypothetical protein